jgi:hypothetical protein
MVLLHPPPPEGPVPGRLLDRMATIRTLQHTGLAAPLATGDLEGRAWVVERRPTATLDSRIDTTGVLSVQETVRILREIARALSALHRAGLAHGMLSAAAIESRGDSVVLHHLGHADGGAVPNDLADLGRVAWLLLVGRPSGPGDRAPGVHRKSLPEALDQLVAGLLDPDPAARPASAELVLEALDRFPVREATPLRALIDGAGRGARSPRERQTAIALGVVGMAVLLAWLFLRPG